MRKFFRIEKNYKFEWNDLRCFVTLVNVIVKDLTTDRKINGLLMHCSNAILNIYFLLMFYNVIK